MRHGGYSQPVVEGRATCSGAERRRGGRCASREGLQVVLRRQSTWCCAPFQDAEASEDCFGRVWWRVKWATASVEALGGKSCLIEKKGRIWSGRRGGRETVGKRGELATHAGVKVTVVVGATVSTTKVEAARTPGTPPLLSPYTLNR